MNEVTFVMLLFIKGKCKFFILLYTRFLNHEKREADNLGEKNTRQTTTKQITTDRKNRKSEIQHEDGGI